MWDLITSYQKNPFLLCLYTHHNFILIYAHTNLEITNLHAEAAIMKSFCGLFILLYLWHLKSCVNLFPKYASLQLSSMDTKVGFLLFLQI